MPSQREAAMFFFQKSKIVLRVGAMYDLYDGVTKVLLVPLMIFTRCTVYDKNL